MLSLALKRAKNISNTPCRISNCVRVNAAFRGPSAAAVVAVADDGVGGDGSFDDDDDDDDDDEGKSSLDAAGAVFAAAWGLTGGRRCCALSLFSIPMTFVPGDGGSFCDNDDDDDDVREGDAGTGLACTPFELDADVLVAAWVIVVAGGAVVWRAPASFTIKSSTNADWPTPYLPGKINENEN